MLKTYEDYIEERKIRYKVLSKWSKEDLSNFINRNYRVHGETKNFSKQDLIYMALDVTHSIPKHISKKHDLEVEIKAANKNAAEISHLLNY